MSADHLTRPSYDGGVHPRRGVGLLRRTTACTGVTGARADCTAGAGRPRGGRLGGAGVCGGRTAGRVMGTATRRSSFPGQHLPRQARPLRVARMSAESPCEFVIDLTLLASSSLWP